MAEYKMMTAGELIEYLCSKHWNKEVNFTFDDLDLDPNCDPEGWYSARLIKIFDESYDVLALGYYGGGSTEVHDVTYYDHIEDRKNAYKKALQKFMNNWCGYNGKCKMICVEVN